MKKLSYRQRQFRLFVLLAHSRWGVPVALAASLLRLSPERVRNIAWHEHVGVRSRGDNPLPRGVITNLATVAQIARNKVSSRIRAGWPIERCFIK